MLRGPSHFTKVTIYFYPIVVLPTFFRLTGPMGPRVFFGGEPPENLINWTGPHTIWFIGSFGFIWFGRMNPEAWKQDGRVAGERF